jgi:hypothetical protein
MKITKNILTFLTIILFGMACLDIITTLNLVNHAGSWDNELNPITKHAWSHIGIEMSVAFKLLLFIFIMFWLPGYACRKTHLDQQLAYNGLVTVNILYVFMVISACFGGLPI